MGATYFKNALSASREHLSLDWDALEEAWKLAPERKHDEDVKRSIEWINADNDGRLSRAGGDPTRTEAVLRHRQEDADIAGLQHHRVSDQQE